MRAVRLIWSLLLAGPAAGQTTGESLYLAQCSFCHGPRGEGGRGATLARPRLRRAPDDAALGRLIRRGIPDTEMPGTSLSDAEIRLVAAYVRGLGRIPSAVLPGDAGRGKQIYQHRGGCTRCHMIQGYGGAFGPDLTGIGARRSAAHLRESLIDPGVDVPRGFVLVRAVPRQGEAVTGVRVNEDTFSIQLYDPGGKLHSFWKSDLQELRKELNQSPMPSYRSALSAQELDDLVAYLAGLQGPS